MTDMKRTTVSFPDDIVFKLNKLKETKEFHNCSYSEIIRNLVLRGLDKLAETEGTQ